MMRKIYTIVDINNHTIRCREIFNYTRWGYCKEKKMSISQSEKFLSLFILPDDYAKRVLLYWRGKEIIFSVLLSEDLFVDSVRGIDWKKKEKEKPHFEIPLEK
ncbi:hypothetical protein T12_7299 [Trichinella patagoniensis]|uniref:Uncharacterized protein n=1 Tax=Trichinella patagoniensis TaxID=990121 RepID=A0A0V0Z8U3_9BILA|nr:hypothetical protein T12_7299 [Trichinella patagoniensis]